MEKKHNKTINETLFIEKLPSGLTCYLLPKKDYVEKQACLAVNYGAADNRFTVQGKDKEMEQGIAHFLEHKLFEGKDGNAFDSFVKYGSMVNAFTNYTNTAYYFNCTDSFQENLKILLEFTQEPYFTEENVEKEKGIITQEIKMYKDNPYWRSFINLQSALYSQCPLRYDIAGTIESISRITPEMLYECYEAFYIPQNMALICAGDFDMDEVVKLADEIIKPGKREIPKVDYGNEPETVSKNYVEDKMDCSMPMFGLGFKDVNNITVQPQHIIAMRVMLDVLFGTSSEFYERLYNEGILDDSFSLEYSGSKFHQSINFSGASKNPRAVAEKILKEIDRGKLRGLDKDRCEIIKRKQLGRYIRSFNSIDGIVNGGVELFSKGLDYVSLAEGFEHVDYKLVSDCVNFFNDNHVLSVVSSE